MPCQIAPDARGDLPETDPFTEKLLTNREVLAVNQTGANPRPLQTTGTYTIWVSDAPGGGQYMGLFNISEAPINIAVPMVSPKKNAKFTVRDLWTGTEVANVKKHEMTINPHGAQLLKIR